MSRYASVDAAGAIRTVVTYGGPGAPPAADGLQWIPVPDEFSAAGIRWDGTAFVAGDTSSQATLEAMHRVRREKLLAACDWTQVSDSPLSTAVREAWALYRQALRDIPQQQGFPAAVEWPQPPA